MRCRSPQIIMYHAVCPPPNNPNKIFTSPERFEAQMRLLKQRNMRGVSMQELRQATSTGHTKGLIGLTFDDGYENFLTYALPILERFGFTATVFVVAGMLGRENEWRHDQAPRPSLVLLGADGVREVSARGIEIGSHGMKHVMLSGLEPEMLEEEVSSSRRVLGDILGKEVEGFCYPYGAVDHAAVRAVRKAQYAYACSYILRVNGDAFDLPRMNMGMDSPLKCSLKLRIYPQYAAARRFLYDPRIRRLISSS